MGEPNLLKLRYRGVIQEIVRSIILEKISGKQVATKIRDLVNTKDIPIADRAEIFSLIENEIVSLHDGKIAQFKVRPSEYEAWKAMQ